MHAKLKISLGIPFVNRRDFLLLAVNSIRPLWPGAFILDNSPDGVVDQESDQWPVEVKWFRGISLTFSQSMNFLFNEAWCRESEVEPWNQGQSGTADHRLLFCGTRSRRSDGLGLAHRLQCRHRRGDAPLV